MRMNKCYQLINLEGKIKDKYFFFNDNNVQIRETRLIHTK
jgi:hypothetical protein